MNTRALETKDLLRATVAQAEHAVLVVGKGDRPFGGFEVDVEINDPRVGGGSEGDAALIFQHLAAIGGGPVGDAADEPLVLASFELGELAMLLHAELGKLIGFLL